jgi:cytochrome c553
MKKLYKTLLSISLSLLILILAAMVYVTTALPNAGPAPDLKIELTKERIERGEKLANNVMACMHCHTPQETTQFAHPIKPEMLGAGGVLFGKDKEGLPGNYYSANLTPTNLGDWTDGEIFRAITKGVSKDGRALFPIMPYPNYAKMAPEDIYDIIAYLRSLKPIDNNVPKSESFFPMNFIVNTIPKNTEPGSKPDNSDPVAWGKYLVTAASCMDCHTPKEKGNNIPGMDLAGGMEFFMEDGSIISSANISPDLQTGIGAWTEDRFIAKFKTYADSSYQNLEIQKGEFNSVMPWINYSRLSEDELKAIYAYLKEFDPVKNAIVRFTPPND